MNRTIVRAIAGGILVTVAFALCGCSNPLDTPTVEQAKATREQAISSSVSTPAIHEDGKLVVGLKTAELSIPMCATDDSNAVRGLDVDVASALADQMGLEVSFVSVLSAKDAVSKNCDIVMDVASGESSDLRVVGRYAESAISFFHNDAAGVATTDQLNGKTVGVQSSSVSQSALSRTSLVMTQKEFSNLNDAFEALNAGTIDYVLCDAYAGGYLSSHYSGINVCGSINVPSSLGVGVLSTNTDLAAKVQTAIDTIDSNGVYDLIRAKWLGGMPQLGSSDQVKGVSTATEAATTSATTTNSAIDQAGSNAVTAAG